MNIAKSFKNVRLSRNFTQEELANQINTTKQMISQIENGVKLPSLNIAIDTANVLNCSLDELVGRDVEVKTRKVCD